ncbi:MAG: cupin domain-containing protein [Filomicrobium sp.]
MAHLTQFRSVIIDSATPTKQMAVKQGGIYIGETIIYSANAEGRVQFGVWEADVRKTKLIDHLSTEYVLMLSGHVVITYDDGTSNEFKSDDTFVMPKGFTSIWDTRERMKKQHIKVGDPNAKGRAMPVKDWRCNRTHSKEQIDPGRTGHWLCLMTATEHCRKDMTGEQLPTKLLSWWRHQPSHPSFRSL